jgi:arylsulfatase A
MQCAYKSIMRMTTRFPATLFLFAGILCFAGCRNEKETVQRPNIVLIMADDMGHEVLGSYGGTSYRTPNLDRLAEEGIRFTHCYSAPKCAPSRVKIMTGRYAFRTTRKWGYIPPGEVTFGHVLDSAGYAVALAGKWQMALLKEDPGHLGKMGFAESSVFGWHEGPRYYNPFIYQNGEILEGVSHRYGPDLFCEFLTGFIERNRDRPFFAYYPMALAHEISNDLDTPPPTGPTGKYQSYRELVEYADVLVGRIVDVLDSLGLREKTLIMFTGDNGTPQSFITEFRDGEYLEEPVFSMMGDSIIPGGKNMLTDAGTHVPLIASWKGTAPAGTTCDDLIDFSDFMPTLAEIAGAYLPIS